MNKDGLLQRGDVIQIDKTHTVYADIPECMAYSNRKNSKKWTHTDVRVADFPFLEGEYVVMEAYSDGGSGTGARDYYPDGHHVFAQFLERDEEDLPDEVLKIDFYQTGCFTAMIENIKPVGKVKFNTKVTMKRIK